MTIEERLQKRRTTSTQSGKAGLAVLAFVVVLTLVFGLGYMSASGEAKARQKVVIHLSQYSYRSRGSALCRTFAGARIGRNLITRCGWSPSGGSAPHAPATGINAEIASHYDAFVKAGDKVLLCPHCAESSGMTAQYLRP